MVTDGNGQKHVITAPMKQCYFLHRDRDSVAAYSDCAGVEVTSIFTKNFQLFDNPRTEIFLTKHSQGYEFSIGSM